MNLDDFDPDEYPIGVVMEICREQNVDPVMLLYVLLRSISQAYLTHARTGFRNNEPRNVETELRSLMKRFGRDEPPVNLLEVILLLLDWHRDENVGLAATIQNAPGNVPAKIIAAQAGDKIENAKVAAALYVIVQRFKNAVDRRAIKEQIQLEHATAGHPAFAEEPPLSRVARIEKLCAAAVERGDDLIVIKRAQSLGGSFNEVMQSLNQITAAGLALKVAPPNDGT